MRGPYLVVGDEVRQGLELARLVHQVGPPAEAQGPDPAAVAHREHNVAVAVPVDLRVEDERQALDVCGHARARARITGTGAPVSLCFHYPN